jgi:ATP-dependent Clp protease ATP-binding subunit ClpA
MRACNVDLEKLKADLSEYIDTELANLVSLDSEDAKPTAGFQRVIQRAVIHVQSSGREEVTGANVLVAIFAERESHAAYFLQEQDMTRYDAVNYISHGIAKRPGADEAKPVRGARDEAGRESEDAEEGSGKESALDAWCVNLNAKARAGKIDPLIGRDAELKRTIQVLCRRSKNNPLYVGDPASARRPSPKGWPRRSSRATCRKFWRTPRSSRSTWARCCRHPLPRRFRRAPQAGDEGDRGARQRHHVHRRDPHGDRRRRDLRRRDGCVEPAEAGARLGQSALHRLDHLQGIPAVFREGSAPGARVPEDRRERAVGAGHDRDPERAEALFRGPPQGPLHNDAIKSAVELSARYINDRKLPDKAIDVIDESGASQKLVPENRRKKVIGIRDIEATIATMARIPPKSVSKDDAEVLAHIDANLKRVVFGQEKAIEALSSAIKLARAGLREPEKPIGNYLFSGPTGVGKTEAARQLAELLGVRLIRFDMSEYMERHTVSRLIGAPPGYVGFDQGGLLTDGVDQTPHCVLLLDEIEKAHPDLFNILLQIMDHGKLTDHNGKQVDFRNVILIMTTNAGASDLAKAAMGFGHSRRTGDDEEAINRLFTPEFRNRLDAIIPFGALPPKSFTGSWKSSCCNWRPNWPIAASPLSSTRRRQLGCRSAAMMSGWAPARSGG